MRPTRIVLPALASSLLFLCCRQSTTAPLAGDRYALESIAGKPLPAPYFPGPNDNYRIAADTIALEGGANGRRRTVYETLSPFARRVEELRFTYTIDGDRLVINLPCPPNADCVPGPHLAGTITNSAVTITQSALTVQPLSYRRVFPPD